MATVGGWKMGSQEDPITVTLPDDYTFDLDNITIPDYTWSNTVSHDDIIIDGMSLKQTLKSLNDRLAILQVNPALEAEFDELHALGEQYRALERKLLEKKAVWDALNK